MEAKIIIEFGSYYICLCARGDNFCEVQGLMGKFITLVKGNAYWVESSLKKQLNQFCIMLHLVELRIRGRGLGN